MIDHLPSLLLFIALVLGVLFLARSLHFMWYARRESRRRADAERALGRAAEAGEQSSSR